MHSLFISLPLIAILGSSVANSQPTSPTKESGNAGGSPREVALDNLLSERKSLDALDKVIADARKNGISEQSILEARFLYHVDHNEDDAIAALLPDFLKQRDIFQIENSSIFNVKEDWLAVIEYVEAISSLKKGDKSAFKTHITEAFWLSPSQASAFAPHIERMRLEESMRSVKIDFESKFNTLTGGDALSLKSLMTGKKAMILHFWSPASSESESTLPDYTITAKALGDAGIAMTSLLINDSPKLVTDARAMIKPLGSSPTGSWLIDRKESSLAHDLRIQALPTFVLISNEGKIIFNGAPDDDALWNALAKIEPKITRPEITGPLEH